VSVITLIIEVLTTASTTRASINCSSRAFVVVVFVIPSPLCIVVLWLLLKYDGLTRGFLDDDGLWVLAYDDGLRLIIFGRASVSFQVPLIAARRLTFYFPFIAEFAYSIRRGGRTLNISFVADDFSWGLPFAGAVLEIAVVSGSLFAVALDDDLFLVGILFFKCAVGDSIAADSRVCARFIAIFVDDRHDDGAGPETAVWYWPLGSAVDKTGGADGGGELWRGRGETGRQATVNELNESASVRLSRLKSKIMQSQATRRGRVQSAATKGLPTVVAGDHPAHLPPASFPPSFFT